MKKLEETVALMQSVDYKERFAAEYYQLETRYLKLKAMCEKWDKGKLDFTPDCPREVYNVQLIIMRFYLASLLLRGYYEKIFTDDKLQYKSKFLKVDPKIKKEFAAGTFSFGYHTDEARDMTWEDGFSAVKTREETNKRPYHMAMVGINGRNLHYAVLQNEEQKSKKNI